MKMLNIKITKEKRALHLRVADSIRHAIIDGRLRPSENLPSARALAEQLGLHRQTIMSGLAELVAEGWVVALPRKGYLVADNISLQFVYKKSRKAQRIAAPQFAWPWRSEIELGSFQPSQPIEFNFQSGLPDLRLFPRAEFHYHLSRAIKNGPVNLLDYGSPQGVTSLVQALETCLRRLKNVTDRTTIITHGSQEAIYLTIQLLIRSDDCVAIEDPGYPPVRALLKSVGARVIPLTMDQEGILPEQLEHLVKKFKLRMLFLTPLHQFPTTATLSAPRRIQIYEIAKRHGIVILEDDYDHEFHYRAQPLQPMASEDTHGQVIYLATLSKLMFPGARMGFMSVPNSFAKNFLQYRRLVTHANDALMQQALAGWMKDGGFERHLNRMRRVYEKRLVALEAGLERLQNQGKNISWHRPNGGMAIWLNTSKNSVKLVHAALEKKVFVTPEKYYRYDDQPGTHLRLGFSNLSEVEIQQGLSVLGRLL